MIRNPKYEEAEEVQNLILPYAEDGKILFRELEEIRRNIADFRVYEMDRRIVGVCSLNTGWDRLLEIRSLCVHPRYYRRGIASALVDRCIEEACAGNGETIFVLTYAVSLFKKFGFSVVDKSALPMKIWTDCQGCLHQENCDEIAMTLPLKSLKKSGFLKIPLPNPDKVLT